jgi:nitrate/nitrite transporter NarK
VRARRSAVAGGSAVGFAAGWNIADTGAVADELADAYGVGLGVVGLFTSALFLVHLAMQLPAGALSDRFGATRVCAAGVATMAACNALALIAPEPALALGTRALMGVGTALAFIGGSDFVRAAGGSPFAQGLYGGLATAGGGVALAVVPAIEPAVGWRSPFGSAIAVAALAAVLLAAAPKPARPGRATAGRAPVRALVGDARLLRLAGVFAASFGLSIVVANWVVTLLEDESSLSGGAAGAVGALVLVLGVVSRPLGGWIVHHRPARTRAALVAVGLAAGISFAPAFTGAAARFPASPGTAIGVVNGAGALAVVVGTALVGVAFAAGGGVWAFMALAAVWAAGGLLATSAPRPRAT